MTQREILEILRAPDVLENLGRLKVFPRRKVIQGLFSALCHPEEEIKRRAVTAMGIIVADWAEEDPEPAREIIRRLLWSLNEESGSIGWGAPEAIGEILARDESLAREYTPILLSYMQEDGNYLEYELLQRGLLWGIGRLAEMRPQLLRDLKADILLLPYLKSPDAQVRCLAVRALERIKNQKGLPPRGEN